MDAKEFQSVCTSPLLTSHFAVEWSEDDRISVITEKGIHIMEVVPSPSSSVPRIALRRSLHQPNPALPTAEIGVDYHALLQEQDRVTAYQLILDPCLTPGLQTASAVTPRFSQVAWSPAGLLHYGRCLLATLTNMGAVKVEWSYNRKWRDAADISACWLDRCRARWPRAQGLSKDDQLQALLDRAAQIKTVALAWSGLRGDHSLLVTAQRDGVLVVWRVDQVQEPASGQPPSEPALVHTLAGEVGIGPPITALRWCGDVGILVGDKSGLLRLWSVQEGRPLRDLYDSQDRIQVTHIMNGRMEMGKGRHAIAFVKDNVLVIVLVDAERLKLDMALHVFQDVAVTGIVMVRDSRLVISTRSGKLYCVECSIASEEGGPKLKLDCQSIPCNINFNYNSCFGIAASQNKMIWVAASCVSKMYDHLIVRQPTIMNFFMISNTEEATPLLVDNPSKTLTKFWDCLEVLRIQCLKIGQRPPVDIDVADLDSLTTYQLRLSLWFTTIALAVGPDTDSELTKQLCDLLRMIRQLLFARHSCDRVERMLTSVVSRGAMENELNCLNLLRTWMLHFVETSAAREHWMDAVARVNAILAGSQGLDELIKEYCVICEAEVTSSWAEADQWLFATCTKGHSVSRCSSSLLPCVTLPYYMCPTCRLPAHRSFVTESEPLCVFCDSILRPDETISLESARQCV